MPSTKEIENARAAKITVEIGARFKTRYDFRSYGAGLLRPVIAELEWGSNLQIESGVPHCGPDQEVSCLYALTADHGLDWLRGGSPKTIATFCLSQISHSLKVTAGRGGDSGIIPTKKRLLLWDGLSIGDQEGTRAIIKRGLIDLEVVGWFPAASKLKRKKQRGHAPAGAS